MGIVDKVMGGLRDKEAREAIHNENESRHETGPAALALGKPSEVTVDDRIGGTHTRNVLEAVTHENITQHAHHEVTPIVNREREETEIHQKVQPVLDNKEIHTHHQHVAPHVSRNIQEDISEDHAARYRSQQQHHDQTVVGEQTHSTSVNAPIVREHVNKHVIEEIQPIIQRQVQRVEHHHTTQQINEVHVKAPVVHSTIVNEPITMEAFAGKAANLAISGKESLTGHSHGSTHSHGTGLGNGNGLGRSGTTATTGTSSSLGSRGAGSGLTNNHTTGLRNSTDSSSSTGDRVSHDRTHPGQFGEVSNTGDRNAYAHGKNEVSSDASFTDKAKAAIGMGHK